MLQRLCTADVAGDHRRAVYTGMLNERGGYEADVTVTRLAHDRYLLVPVRRRRCGTRCGSNGTSGRTSTSVVVDVSSSYAVYGVMGPKARGAAAAADPRRPLATEAFPFGTSREIDLGYSTVRATRITYVGELGWELLRPLRVRRRRCGSLIEAGADLPLTNAGLLLR